MLSVARMGGATHTTPDIPAALARVDRLFGSPVARRGKRERSFSPETVRDVQVAAVHHPDPHIRRSCLWLLDHHANDVSMPVFARALEDDVDFVRDMALHALACEGCKQGELCVADVVAPLVRVLEGDPKPDLRIKALSALAGLSARDDRVPAAIRRAARENTDGVVRACAKDAAGGAFVMPRKRSQRSQRRHAALGHGTLPGLR